MTREEAKSWLHRLYARADITDEYGDMEDMQPYEEAINMAISALSENKGEWIESKERSGHWYCSACGGIHTDPETGKWREIFDYKYPFCPNCGADMRGEA